MLTLVDRLPPPVDPVKWCACHAYERVHPHKTDRRVHEGRPCPTVRVGWESLVDSQEAPTSAALIAEMRTAHWLMFDKKRRITGCHCGFKADMDSDCGWGDSVVQHLLSTTHDKRPTEQTFCDRCEQAAHAVHEDCPAVAYLAADHSEPF